MANSPKPDTSNPSAKIKLRLLATTDVHGHLLPYDYFANRKSSHSRLAKLAPVIAAARAECANSLLFDNGDYLQGTPLTDLHAADSATQDHPAITAMNLLRYDAANLGNHEFNFGLDWLMATLDHADFPITCANLVHAGQQGGPLVAAHVVLDRQMTDEDGADHEVKVAVIGLAPPQVMTWDQYHLQGRVESLDMVSVAREQVQIVRDAGADLVVLLAHTGIDTGPETAMMENAAVYLSMIEGVDAIVTGHTHEVFPSERFEGLDAADLKAGTLNGIPLVMPGSAASHLGIIDLTLAQRAQGGWQVCQSQSALRQPAKNARVDDALVTALQPAHERTLHLTGKPLGHTDTPMHSYLSMVKFENSIRIVTEAQRQATRQVLRQTRFADLPILSASTSFKAGGRAGPDHYIDIPPGPLCLRHAADLYGFPNLLCALHITGAELRDWLERAAIGFRQIVAGEPGQLLCDPGIPGHQFDIVDGVSYEIDLSQPPRYALSGEVINPNARRIRNLRRGGQAVTDQQEFILATNNYRAFGGGPYLTARPEQFAYTGRQILRDVVADYIRKDGMRMIADAPSENWRFCAMAGTEVILLTGPGLRRYPEDIAALGARDLGDDEAGFMRLALPL